MKLFLAWLIVAMMIIGLVVMGVFAFVNEPLAMTTLFGSIIGFFAIVWALITIWGNEL